MMRTIVAVIALFLAMTSSAQGWEEKYQNDKYTVETTRICDRDATIIKPKVANGRWIVRPAFMGAFPQVDEALLERGWTFGYFNVTDEYATPTAQRAFTEFYDYARKKYNLSERVVLEGLSRGGWFSLCYAVNNPEKIEKLYIDAPLSDLDLMKEHGDAYVKILDKWEADGVKRDEVHDYPRRHFDRIKDIPIICVYGAADEIVHLEKQFGTYNFSGCKDLSLIGKTDCGHHPHSLNPCDTIVNFLTKVRPVERAVPTVKQLVAFDNTLQEFKAHDSDLHSIMVMQHGNVLFEKWQSQGAPDKPHALYSCSKTFCATAVGFAVAEGLLSIDDPVLKFFPDKKPKKVSKNLKAMTVRHLLTMTCGHGTDPTGPALRGELTDWEKAFLEYDVPFTPGTEFCYNSLGTYMLSAIVTRLTGEKIVDYLRPRLFEPLGITGATWSESPSGANAGGWGLSLKTEDLARMGQCLLQGGQWEGRQVIPASWVAMQTSWQVQSIPGGQIPENRPAQFGQWLQQYPDWCQGYGFQMWRCRNRGFRADGASSQFILVFPELDAVIVTTMHDDRMQEVLDTLYKNILPVLE